MTINTDLLLEIREQITDHPGTHDQDEWGVRTDCGTTHCIAGWAAVLTGAALDWRYAQMYAANGQDPGAYAQAVMGLGREEAFDLFCEYDNAKALVMLDELIEKGKNAA